MKYEIKGTPLPVVICTLEPGESMITERGAMSWMSDNFQMETSAKGGAGKAFGRLLAGDSFFQNRYTATGKPGLIAFSNSFPGQILPLSIRPGFNMVVQKTAFLAAQPGVNLSIFFQKRIGAGFFGGEGFIMQKLSGEGLAFVEIDGMTEEYNLAPGESMLVDNGYVAMMDESVTLDIQTVKGLKNIFLGGEGLFLTKVTGPGRVWLQTMPLNKVAASIIPFLPSKN